MRQFGSFSDAIRFGARLTPNQAFRKFFEEGATCAAGAAIHAWLERPLTDDDVSVEGLKAFVKANHHFAYLVRVCVDPPCGCEGNIDGSIDPYTFEPVINHTLNNIIVHLNNVHRWSREEIADWLQGEEDKLGYVTLSEPEHTAESVDHHAAIPQRTQIRAAN